MHQCAGRASSAQEVEKQIHDLGMQDGRRLEMFSCRRSSGEDKNSRADDRADAKRRERPWPKSFLEPILRIVRVGNELVDGFAAEQLTVGGALSGGLRQFSQWKRLQ